MPDPRPRTRQRRAKERKRRREKETNYKGERFVPPFRKKTDNPREGWEDGTPPPHRDFKERSVMR